jgi:hypothetical protein
MQRASPAGPAERDRRAIVIRLRGKAGCRKMAEATAIRTAQEGAMTLRMLRTLSKLLIPNQRRSSSVASGMRKLLPDLDKTIRMFNKGPDQKES